MALLFFFIALGISYYLLFFYQDENLIDLYNFLGETGSHIVVWILAILVGVQAHSIFGNPYRKCAWCNERLTNENFVSGREGPRYWKHENKDGSKDKRFKDNYQQATFTSKFKCKECGAETQYVHEMSRNPGKNASIRLRKLLSEGEGERKGFDIE